MYHGNCGKEIESEIALCLVCSLSIGESKRRHGDRIYCMDKDIAICFMALGQSNQKVYKNACVNGGLNVTDEYVLHRI